MRSNTSILKEKPIQLCFSPGTENSKSFCLLCIIEFSKLIIFSYKMLRDAQMYWPRTSCQKPIKQEYKFQTNNDKCESISTTSALFCAL